MKAIIVATPKEFTNHDSDYNMLSWFNEFLLIITTSKNEDELREKMQKKIGLNKRYFHYGFSTNGMWVSQSNKFDETIDESKRLIYVDFNNQ